MKQYCLTTPGGARDILLEECEAQGWIEGRLRDCFRACGYRQVVTPGLEYLDVYATGPGNAGSEYMFKVLDNEGRIMVLRPDSTAPIARLAASRLKKREKPLRLYYNQRVYRQKGMYSGRPVETSQMGVELLGAGGLRADLEMLQLAMEALESCGLRDYRIELGHGGLCELLLSRLGVSEAEKGRLRGLIQAKNYPALSDCLDAANPGDSLPARRALRALPGLFGGPEVFDGAAAVFTDPETKEILAYLRTLFDALRRLGLRERLALDLGFVNDNDYYTGVIFQAFIPGLGEAALLGGRYDRLSRRFGESLPAVGFGVNVDLLAKNRLDSGRQEPEPPPRALVWGQPGFEVAGLQYARTLRETPGYVAENALFDNLAQCGAYAAAKGIGQIHVVGEDVAIMETGDIGRTRESGAAGQRGGGRVK